MRALFLMIPVLALSLLGCSDGSVPPVPVSGKVLVDGKPIEGATVTFLSQAKEGGRSASGRTNKDGTFKLTTAKTDDGAPPGEYTVTIAKQESKLGGGNAAIDINASGGPGAGYGQAMGAAGSGNMAKVMKDLLPAKYGSAATSGLTRTVVKSEKNEFEFDL